MKKNTLLILSLLFTCSSLFAQVRIIEVDPNAEQFTLKNFSATEVNITDWRVCSRPSYGILSSLGVPNPFPAGQSYTVSWTLPDEGEVAIYTTNSYNSSAAIRDFFKYGNNSTTRMPIAVAAGIWSDGDSFDISGTTPWLFNGDGMTEYGLPYWSETLSTDEFSFENSINVFPNPNDGHFNIRSTTFPITKVIIYNMLGKIIYDKNMNEVLNTSIDLKVHSGIYLVEIYSGNTKIIKRLFMK